ncbi:hypothetical protein BaRGS_00002145, partial [Batillaria attramentaria]
MALGESMEFFGVVTHLETMIGGDSVEEIMALGESLGMFYSETETDFSEDPGYEADNEDETCVNRRREQTDCVVSRFRIAHCVGDTLNRLTRAIDGYSYEA